MSVFTFERAHTAPDAARLATSRPIPLPIRPSWIRDIDSRGERPLKTVNWHGARRCANRSQR